MFNKLEDSLLCVPLVGDCNKSQISTQTVGFVPFLVDRGFKGRVHQGNERKPCHFKAYPRFWVLNRMHYVRKGFHIFSRPRGF